MFQGIDLYSDTVTLPTQAMKNAMMEAPLGDEQKGEDPTTLQLEEMAAELLGHESAMFFPSASMANELALRLLCEPGDELVAAEDCHLFFAETGGPAVHAGVMIKPIKTSNGIFKGDDVRAAYRLAKGPHYPRTRCVSVENTTNMGGGIAWDFETLTSVLDMAEELKLTSHLDGSRLFNAVIRTGKSSQQLASRFDTVTLCLSKGLGCPMGAILAFGKKHYEKVRRLKQLWGGALRQSGIVAAAGIYALNNHVQRLADDHANAERLASRLREEIKNVVVENHSSATNMVFFEWVGKNLSAAQFNEQCIKKGLRFSHVGEKRFRAVTHLNIQPSDIDKAITILKEMASENPA